jgi:uncharacterized membrane protein
VLWQATAFALLAPVLAWAAWTAPWRRFDSSEAVHVWYGTIFCLIALWSLKASLAPGLVFHLLGIPLFTLLAGPRLALVGTAVVVAIVTVLRDGAWANYALGMLVLGVAPVIVAAAVLRAAERWLAANFFVYVFVASFFGPALAMLAAGALASAVVVLAGAMPAAIVIGQWLPYLMSLGFAEATLTGMLITLLVVYQPAWVHTFDDARYLHGR